MESIDDAELVLSQVQHLHFRSNKMQVRLQSATSNGCIKLGTAAQEGMRTRREDGRHYQKEREEGGIQGWTDGRREGRLRLADRQKEISPPWAAACRRR